MTIRSDKFDDIYFSPENGLAETRYVFLEHNGLPQAWQKAKGARDAGRPFVIAETGFGTGLNFLAAWALFEETAPPDKALHFISFEKYPLSWARLYEALSLWHGLFEKPLAILKKQYPLLIPGVHVLELTERVRLTLIFDDVNDALPELDVPGGVDAWFLDGFAPSKNPGMWTETVFNGMARLSHRSTSFSTFTAAGAVRRGLQDAGFEVNKVPGYGRKRDMLAGRYQGVEAVKPRRGISAKTGHDGSRVAVIGGGLAGTATAYILKRRGIRPVVFEKEKTLAAGASGNETGLLNPRFSKERSPHADFYMTAWALAVRVLGQIQQEFDVGFRACGALHLASDKGKVERFQACLQNWDWAPGLMQWLFGEEARQIAGLQDLDHEALYLPDAAIASPQKLCEFYARDIDVRLGHEITDLTPGNGGWRVAGESFDAVILACGRAVTDYKGCEWLPLHEVRGQVTKIRTIPALEDLDCALCYGGYCAPNTNGEHIVGATFQPWCEDPEPRNGDDDENLQKLQKSLSLAEKPEICGHRTSFRTSSKDRFPVIGAVPDIESWRGGEADNIDGLYTLTGLGSHGIVGSLYGSVLLADLLEGGGSVLPGAVQKALSPARFLVRRQRKGLL